MSSPLPSDRSQVISTVSGPMSPTSHLVLGCGPIFWEAPAPPARPTLCTDPAPNARPAAAGQGLRPSASQALLSDFPHPRWSWRDCGPQGCSQEEAEWGDNESGLCSHLDCCLQPSRQDGSRDTPCLPSGRLPHSRTSPQPQSHHPRAPPASSMREGRETRPQACLQKILLTMEQSGQWRTWFSLGLVLLLGSG